MKKEKIKIQITFNTNDFTYHASVAPNRHISLFKFNHYWDKWLFYTCPHEHISEAQVKISGGFGDDFPMEYFTKLCQARYMIATGATDFPEVELTKTAKKVLTQEYAEKQYETKYGGSVFV